MIPSFKHIVNHLHYYHQKKPAKNIGLFKVLINPPWISDSVDENLLWTKKYEFTIDS